jgi:hypothetical protein
MRVCGAHSPGFLASYWSAGFRTFLQVSALFSHWLEDWENFTPTQEEKKKDRYSANHFGAIQAASQSTFQYTILLHLRAGNDKNKHVK